MQNIILIRNNIPIFFNFTFFITMKKILVILLTLFLGIYAKAEWRYQEISNTDSLINDQPGFTLIIPLDSENILPVMFAIDNTENRNIYSLIYTEGETLFTHQDYMELFYNQSIRSSVNAYCATQEDSYYIKYILINGGTLTFSFITKDGIKTFSIEPITTINSIIN